MTTDFLIDNFTDSRFKAAFTRYSEELGTKIKDYDKLFDKMNNDSHGKNLAYIRTNEGGEAIGFIQFTELDVTSWFFNTRLGFIREFWVAEDYRGCNHGTELIRLTEDYFRDKGLFLSILTTDTAEGFYTKLGYTKIKEIIPDNDGETFVKYLK